jgi:MraZ protein
VPARYRDRLGKAFVLTLVPAESCLVLYPLVTWEAFCERLETAPVKDEAFRRFVRELSAHTEEEVGCDAQGRLLIPPLLRAKAGIEREVVTIGALSRVEVWSPARLDGQRPSEDDSRRIATELGLY